MPLKVTASPEGNEAVAATAYQQLVQGALGLPECTEMCTEVTKACKFEVANDKCPWNANPPRAEKPKVYRGALR